jgi:predicted MFS family arabinose efflux permease
LLPPALVLVLYGADHIADKIGAIALSAALVLLALFIWTARAKGDRALIDIKLFGRQSFRAAAVTQFLSFGVAYAGQMLIPVFLIVGCGKSPGEAGVMLTPMGLGMMCTYPMLGTLTRRFGIRKVAAGGALIATLSTSSFLWLASHPLDPLLLALALFMRGIGQSAIGIPSVSSAYATVDRQRLAMATTSLNIVQRLGGPILTTLAAIFLQWRLGATDHASAFLGPMAMAFLLLSALHALVFLATLRLPLR